jgi:hypothetical protein
VPDLQKPREHILDGGPCWCDPEIAHVAASETTSDKIDRLARLISENVPGEPSQSQGAVDTALRWIRENLPGSETTPPAEYDELRDLVSILMTRSQVALVVISLMEQSKRAQSTVDQMGIARLALGLNDLIVGEDDGRAESS